MTIFMFPWQGYPGSEELGMIRKIRKMKLRRMILSFVFLSLEIILFKKKMWIFQIQGKVIENFIFGYFNSEKILSRTSDFKKVVGRGGRTRSWEHHLNDDPTRFQVFCRSLGFSGGIKYKDEVRPTPGPGFGQLLGRFNCRGDEINVGDCIRDTQYMPGLKHYICIYYIRK